MILFCRGQHKFFRAIPHNSKCRLRRARCGRCQAKSADNTGCCKGERRQWWKQRTEAGAAVAECEGLLPPKHDAGTATRHYRAFWQRRCRAAAAGAVLKPQGGNCAVLPRISPDQTKSAQPRRQASAARLCAKAKSLLFFLCFCLRNQNRVRSFCTADPVVLAPCLDCSDYSILPKFCKHFLSASGGFWPPAALFY